MDTRRLPHELAFDLARRRGSHDSWRMAAVLVDRRGIFSWGWNHMDNGHSIHAEKHAIKNANPRRIPGSILWVVGLTRADRPILAKPCDLDHKPHRPVPRCMPLIRKYGIAKVIYSTPTGFETLVLNQPVR